MFLDTENNNTNILLAEAPALEAAPLPHEAWQHFPHSCISHHGAACCDTARAWVLAMDHSLLAGASPLTGPRWLRARYDWGPSKHPIYWCEAAKRKTLDCGALGALAMECFRARGVEAYPLQMVQRYSADAASHWASRWAEEEGASTHWLRDDVIYHEGCAVRQPDGSIRLWDASAGWWVQPSPQGGYGSLAALRVWAPEDTSMLWETTEIPAGEWVAV